MKREETKVTLKYQTTIPKEVRRYLGIKPGKEVEWHIVKGMVVVDAKRKIEDPVKFLTSQFKM
ncbi:MAG: type II toxin-antitoxin system PrlF family antitoxin, partial [Nitrososphaerota archaeon]